MNYERLIDDLKRYATQYASGATLGRAIEETEDLMFEAAVAIESLTKADSWTLVEDKLPPNEVNVLACVEITCGLKNKAHYIIVKAFYTDGMHYCNESSYDWCLVDQDDYYDEEKDDYKIPAGWWESTFYNEEFCNIPDKVIAWMSMPEMPRIKEMRQK